MRVELVGLPGSGKTSVAKALSTLGWLPLFEEYRTNPFWSTALSGATDWFSADVVFLLQHRNLVSKHVHIPQRTVCDFSFITDRLYAERRTFGQALLIYERLHDFVTHEIPPPSYYVVLDASAERIVSNVRTRGRGEEQGIDSTVVARQVEALRHLAETLPPDRLVIANMERYRDAQSVAAKVANLREPREPL